MEAARLTAWLALLLVVFVPLERLFGASPQAILRRGFWADLGWYFLNSLGTKSLLLLPLAAVGAFAHGFVPTGYLAAVAALPAGVRFLLALIVGELGFYWGHRWSHELPFLWRFHAVHHSAEEMDWLVNTKLHPVDMIFTRLCGFMPMYLLGLAQPSADRFDLVPLLVIVVGTFWGFFIHSNIRIGLGWLGWFVSTPSFHHWHHTNEDHRDRNYASVLPVMDRLFGTLARPATPRPARYGIDDTMPSGLVGQLLYPLHRPGTDAGQMAELARRTALPRETQAG